MGFLGLCEGDPIVSTLRGVFGANIVRVPEERVKPYSVVAMRGDQLSFRGALAPLLGAAVTFDAPAASKMADVAGKRSRKVEVKLGLEILSGFLRGFGVPAPGVVAHLANASTVSFAFRNVERQYVDVNVLGQRLGGARLDFANAASAIFRQGWTALVIDSVITSSDFSIALETKQGGGVALDLPAIQKVVAAAEVGVEVVSESERELVFRGPKALTFAFTCVRLFLDAEGRISALPPQTQPVFLEVAASGVDTSVVHVAPPRLVLGARPALVEFEAERDAASTLEVLEAGGGTPPVAHAPGVGAGEIAFTGRLLVKLRPRSPEDPRPSAAAIDRLRRFVDAEPRLREVGPLLEGVPGVDPSSSRWHALAFAEETIGAATATNASARDELWSTVRQLLEVPGVEYVEPSAEAGQALPPAAPANLEPLDQGLPPGWDWHLEIIRARDAWKRFPADREPGAGIRIAHLDTGWRPHPALPTQLRGGIGDRGIDLTGPGDRDAEDRRPSGDFLDHGTGTLCLLAGKGELYRGVAWGSEVLPIRIQNHPVHVATESMAKAIAYATAHGARVMTISAGGLPSLAWSNAVDAAYLRGILICAAAGNHLVKKILGVTLRTPFQVVYPARFPRAMAVAGIMKGDRKYWFDDRMSGNEGRHVDIAAPTPDVTWALTPGDGWRQGEGTSTATPQVAGAAALWFSLHAEALSGFEPWEQVEACRWALMVSAQKAGEYPYAPHPLRPGLTGNRHFGAGRLDVAAALDVKPLRGLPQMLPDELHDPGFEALSLGGPELDRADQIELLWLKHQAAYQLNESEVLLHLSSGRLRQRLTR